MYRVDKLYTVVKVIKIHTKPLRTVKVIQTGRFKKETQSYYIFNSFRVRKSAVLTIRICEG